MRNDCFSLLSQRLENRRLRNVLVARGWNGILLAGRGGTAKWCYMRIMNGRFHPYAICRQTARHLWWFPVHWSAHIGNTCQLLATERLRFQTTNTSTMFNLIFWMGWKNYKLLHFHKIHFQQKFNISHFTSFSFKQRFRARIYLNYFKMFDAK